MTTLSPDPRDTCTDRGASLPGESVPPTAAPPRRPQLRDTFSLVLTRAGASPLTLHVPIHASSERVSFYRDSHGDWRWAVRSGDGTVIADAACGQRTWDGIRHHATSTIEALLRGENTQGIEQTVAIWLSQLDRERCDAVIAAAKDRRTRRPAARRTRTKSSALS